MIIHVIGSRQKILCINVITLNGSSYVHCKAAALNITLEIYQTISAIWHLYKREAFNKLNVIGFDNYIDGKSKIRAKDIANGCELRELENALHSTNYHNDSSE